MRPLADKIRPDNIKHFIGQHDLLDENKPLYNILKNKTLISMILYGPPGTGKTTLSKIYAKTLNIPLETFNAATDNKTTLKSLINNHKDQTFILLIDEIHRLTKPIQDHLLPYIENGTLVLIGTTTKNPIITIDPAIRSRSVLFEFKSINNNDISNGLQSIYQRVYNQQIDNTITDTIAQYSNGDFRFSINSLETLLSIYNTELNSQKVHEYMRSQSFIFDKNGDYHYNTLSALQKSIRGSDTDAALYYTGVMCNSGDLDSLIRRLIVIAYEDIGLADPKRVQQAVTALIACKDLGLPEARIPIANAVILLCTTRHSNSAYKALDNAIEDAKNNYPIPYHLRDTHYKGSKKLNHNQVYKYPHDYENHWVKQQYLPDVIKSKQYYHPNTKSETDIYKTYLGLKTLQNKD